MKLARRLTLMLAIVLCAVLALDTVLHLHRLAALYRADAERDERLLARAIAPVFAAEWSARGEDAARALLEATQRNAAPMRLRFVRTDGVEFGRDAPDVDAAAWSAPDAGDTPRSIVREGSETRRLYTYAPIHAARVPSGALEVSEPLAGEQELLASRLRGSAVAGLAMLAWSVGFTWLAGHRLVGRPVHALVEKARRTAEGDFSHPIGLRGSDELAALAREMDQMALRLEESRDRLAAETAAKIAAVEQMRRADRLSTVGTLAAGVAHELGTPLAIVAGQARRIADGDVAGGDETAAAAASVLDQTERMGQIVRRLLDFSRHAPVEKEVGDLVSCTRQTVGLLSAIARARGISLAFEAEASLAPSRFDGRRLQQAIANLVVNAVHACGRGGQIRVSVSRRAASPHPGEACRDCLAVEVEDDGPGIAPDVLPRIFDPFFTTKPEGEGTGLGLSVAHGIVAEHGGWIDVQSAPGRGSRFGIRLPIDALDENEGASDEEALRGDATGFHASIG